MRTDVKGWGILLLLDPASLGGNCAFNDVFELFQGGLDLPVALGDLALINPVKLQRLGKFEDVFLTPVSLERSRYGLLVRPNPGVAVLRQLVCIPLTSDDVLDDRHAGLAGDRVLTGPAGRRQAANVILTEARSTEGDHR